MVVLKHLLQIRMVVLIMVVLKFGKSVEVTNGTKVQNVAHKENPVIDSITGTRNVYIMMVLATVMIQQLVLVDQDPLVLVDSQEAPTPTLVEIHQQTIALLA